MTRSRLRAERQIRVGGVAIFVLLLAVATVGWRTLAQERQPSESTAAGKASAPAPPTRRSAPPPPSPRTAAEAALGLWMRFGRRSPQRSFAAHADPRGRDRRGTGADPQPR